MTWYPHQYFTCAGQWLRPALDLIQHVPLENPKTIVDLGCGGGNVTKALRDRWPDAEITGIDKSPDMLAHARREAPDMQWQQADIAAWSPPGPVDLLFKIGRAHV